MKKLVVFASGSGSDFQSIIDNVEKGKINGKIVRLIASKEGIGAIDRANKHNIPVSVFAKANYDNLNIMYDEIITLLKSDGVDLIILAGYLTILTHNIVDAFRNKIINIHPSLIPAYCGKGFYGMKVHEAVIANKEKFSGATVHFVDEGADTGKIIAQEKVQVFPSDTPQSLQQRVLELEHILLPNTIANLCK